MVVGKITKYCQKCACEQVHSEYAYPGRKVVVCLECRRKYANSEAGRQAQLKWRQDHPAAYLQRNADTTFRKLNFTRDEFDDMLRRQNGLCAICGSPPLENQRLSIDHCHTTVKVRALLCVACNTLLGQAGDQIEILEQAIEYLRNF